MSDSGSSSSSGRDSVDINEASSNSEQEEEDNRFCECFTYFFFLIMFTVMCMRSRTLGSHNFWISNQFKYSIEEGTYADVLGQSRFFHELNEVEDIYLFLNQLAMPLLFVNYTFNKENLNSTKRNFALGHNKLLGGVRLTLIRSNVEDCKYRGLPAAFGPCYPEYSAGSTNKSTYQVAGYNMTYLTASEAQSSTFTGNYLTYNGDGNVYDLNPDPSKAYVELQELWHGGLIKRDSRVLFFDFVTLNPNLNLHTIGRLCFELPTDGGVITKSEVKTWRFWKYLGGRGRTLFASEIIMVLMIIYYTWWELSEIYLQGFVKYRESTWNIVDWINLVFFYLTIFWRIAEFRTVKPSMTNLHTYESYRGYVRIYSMEAYFNMVNGALLYFKLFKYLNASRKMRLLFAMFYKTWKNMFVFIIILFVFYLAYGVAGFLLFSSDVSDYRRLRYAIFNLFRYTVTDMDYDSLKRSSIVGGNIYYVTWTLIMLLILVNVFVAILTQGYEDAQEDCNEDTERMFRKFIPGFIRKSIFQTIDIDKSGYLDAAELSRIHGITLDEAKKIIAKYDTNNDGKCDLDEFSQYYMRHSKLDEAEPARAHGITKDEAKNIIAKYDTNNHGKRDLDEFSQYYMRHSKFV